MPRPRKTDRPRKLEIYLPASIHAKMESELFSEIEGRVPHGRWSAEFETMARNWLKERELVT